MQVLLLVSAQDCFHAQWPPCTVCAPLAVGVLEKGVVWCMDGPLLVQYFFLQFKGCIFR